MEKTPAILSPNATMQALYNAQVARTTLGTLDFTLEDVGTTETLSGQCLITKEPDRAKTAEAANYQWTLHVASDTPWNYIARADSEDMDCLLTYLTYTTAFSRAWPPRGAPGKADPDGVWIGLGSYSKKLD